MKSTVNAVAGKSFPSAIFSGLLAALAITCAAFIACALLMTYAGLSERAVPVIVSLTCVASVVVAGFDTSRHARSRGWLWGMAAGGAYAIVLFVLLFVAAKSFSLDFRKVTLAVMALAGGALGGVLGINAKR